MTDPAIPAMVQASLLYLHGLNTRSEPPPEDIAALAASIEACGLLQNLLGYHDPARPGEVGIVAGGRRLRALRQLGTADATPVPVQITDDLATARAWASVENTARTALHPADEIRAYGRMAKAGQAVPAIARAFAVTEAHVTRRLRLARLPAPVIDALRADRITLDAAQALTLCDDEARTLDTLTAACTRDWNAAQIRHALVQQSVRATDRRAVFAGAEYEAAGGTITRDLFSSESYLDDPKLLDELFAHKLAGAAEIFKAAGWGWAHVNLGTSLWDDPRLKGLQQAKPPSVPLPEADAAELEALKEQPFWQLDPDQKARYHELTARTIGDFEDGQMAQMGVVVFVDHSGKPQVEKGWHKPEPAASGTPGASATAAAESLPESLRMDLAAIRLGACQAALMAKSELALDLLGFGIEGAADHAAVLAVQFGTPQNAPGKADAWHLPPALAADPGRSWKTPAAADLRAYLAREGGKRLRNQALSLALARSLQSMGGDILAEIEALAGANIRAHWRPTAENYFARLPDAHLIAIATEILQPDPDDDRFAAFVTLKKKEKARELDALFGSPETREAWGLSRDTTTRIDHWLPPQMRPGA